MTIPTPEEFRDEFRDNNDAGMSAADEGLLVRMVRARDAAIREEERVKLADMEAEANLMTKRMNNQRQRAEAAERERDVLRERLAFSRAGNATLTECGANMARDPGECRRQLTEARELLEKWRTDYEAYLSRCEGCELDDLPGFNVGTLDADTRAFLAPTKTSAPSEKTVLPTPARGADEPAEPQSELRWRAEKISAADGGERPAPIYPGGMTADSRCAKCDRTLKDHWSKLYDHDFVVASPAPTLADDLEAAARILDEHDDEHMRMRNDALASRLRDHARREREHPSLVDRVLAVECPIHPGVAGCYAIGNGDRTGVCIARPAKADKP